MLNRLSANDSWPLRLREILAVALPQSGFKRSASILAGGTLIGQIIMVAASPLLTRLYSAEDFGHLQVYLNILLFLGLVSALRYELAILLPKEDQTAANLVAVSLSVVFAFSLLSAVSIWWLGRSLFLPIDTLAVRKYFWLLPISMLGLGVYQTLSSWALRQKAYKQVAATKLTQAVSQVGVQLIWGGLVHSGAMGLLLADAVGRTNGSLSLGRLAWRRSQMIFLRVSLRGMWEAAVRYRHFPLISSGAALLNTAGIVVPSLVIARFYGPAVLGWFALVERVLGMPSVTVGQAVSQVYMSEAARLARTDVGALRSLFVKTFKRLLLVGMAPCVVILLIGPSLFAFVFGEQWREAGNYARILALMQYASFVSWPLLPTLNILELQSWQLAWDIGRLSTTLLFLLITYRWGATARGVVLAYGSSLFSGYLLHLFLCYTAIQRRIGQVESTS